MSIEMDSILSSPNHLAALSKPKNLDIDKEQNSVRFGRILTALGSEPKCIVLLCLKGEALSAHYLHKKFQEETGAVWQMNPRNQANYCDLTLIPQGLVGKDNNNQYFLTEDGLKLGIPAATFLIVKSSKLPFSLMSLFGATNTAGTVSSAVNRATILEILSRKLSPVREIDLEDESGISRKVIGPHLKALTKIGVVQYQAVNFETPGVFKYQVTPGAKRQNAKKVRYLTTLTGQVADILFEEELVDTNMIFTLLKDRYPDTKTLRQKIGEVLSGLEKQGLCAASLFKSGEKHSTVGITPLGEQIVDEIIVPLKRAISGNQELLSSWSRLPWQAHAAEVIEKYAAKSGHVHGVDFSKRVGAVYTLIQQTPGIRPREIQAEIGGRPPYDLINWLLEQGKIRKVRVGKTSHYYVIE